MGEPIAEGNSVDRDKTARNLILDIGYFNPEYLSTEINYGFKILVSLTRSS
jgi:hypothetical protein